jgi:hypothetical protein
MQAKHVLAEAQTLDAHAILKDVEVRRDRAQRPANRTVMQIRLQQAVADLEQSRFESALTMQQDGTDGYAQTVGMDHPRILLAAVLQARPLWATHQPEKALALLDHAIPILQEVMGADAPTFIKIQALRQELASTSPNPSTARQLDLLM